MDQYRTWLSGLKSALQNFEIETLTSTIAIAVSISLYLYHSTHINYLDLQYGTLQGLPQELRRSTFVGQPQVLETLYRLQTAISGGEDVSNMRASLSNRIQEWESITNPTNHQPIPSPSPGNPSPSPGHFSLPPPSPVSQTQSESSYDSAEVISFATRRQMVS
jgi:hypothetical protein